MICVKDFQKVIETRIAKSTKHVVEKKKQEGGKKQKKNKKNKKKKQGKKQKKYVTGSAQNDEPVVEKNDEPVVEVVEKNDETVVERQCLLELQTLRELTSQYEQLGLQMTVEDIDTKTKVVKSLREAIQMFESGMEAGNGEEIIGAQEHVKNFRLYYSANYIKNLILQEQNEVKTMDKKKKKGFEKKEKEEKKMKKKEEDLEKKKEEDLDEKTKKHGKK